MATGVGPQSTGSGIDHEDIKLRNILGSQIDKLISNFDSDAVLGKIFLLIYIKWNISELQ